VAKGQKTPPPTAAELSAMLTEAGKQMQEAVEKFKVGITEMQKTPEWQNMLKAMEAIKGEMQRAPDFTAQAQAANKQLLLERRLHQFRQATQGWRTDAETMLSHYVRTVVGVDYTFPGMPEVFYQPLTETESMRFPGLTYVGNEAAGEIPDGEMPKGRVILTGSGVFVYHHFNVIEQYAYRQWSKHYAHAFRLHYDVDLSRLVENPPRRGFDGWK
jgi:hypothetical protein